ncbi:MAG: hypothetical protein E7595_03330 [Ruminococcaceae bacterium]|nr:hypothetical protein [Oscillospiraceae bacterium]
MNFTFNDYILDVDIEKMKSVILKNYKCQCAICKAFREYADTLDENITAKLIALGVNIERPDEVFDIGEDENQNVCYSGWWNIYGKILTKSQTPYQISDGFELTFCDDSQYAPRWFQGSDYFQMRFLIRKSQLKRIGKKYQVGDKTVFSYHIGDNACANMYNLIGGKIFKIYSDSIIKNDAQIKCHNVEIFIENESRYQKLSLSVSRDLDTCFDGIDRMALTLDSVNIDSTEAELLLQDDIISCSMGKIKCIKVFESTIEGENDKVVYDSHIVIEDDLGKKLIFRAEPDGEEVMTVFTDIDDNDVEKYLRVSDTWFVNDDSAFYENNEIDGVKNCYKTETKLRVFVM